MSSRVYKEVASAGLVSFLTDDGASPRPCTRSTRPVIGVLEGTGIGPQVIRASLDVLAAVEQVMGLHFDVQFGGPIGEEAEIRFGRSLPDSAVTFCQGIFDQKGAILSGPGGGRYVYDLRRHFDLFCKFVPVRPWPALARVGRVTPAHVRNVDILFVRDNVGGVYQGQWQEQVSAEGRLVEHSFRYSEPQVRRLVAVAARAAAARRGGLHVVIKDGGMPGISALWRDVGAATAREYGVRAIFMNVDLAAYELIQNPAQFDVLVTPNLFGDILVDVAGVLQSSRGVTFSGNFRADGGAVYQTNHGCAHDLAGLDVANPAGQILSLAMLLRESFALAAAANFMEEALTSVWRQGGRTADLAEPGCTVLGTQAMADRVAREISSLAEARSVA
jgi:3-isopropylmalate dehydrogenase